jgi:hypothetical protein
MTSLVDLIDLDDLATPETPTESNKTKGRRSSKSQAQAKLPKLTMPFAAKPLDSPVSATSSADGLMTPTDGMSARQLNVLKRKAKANKSSSHKYKIFSSEHI